MARAPLTLLDDRTAMDLLRWWWREGLDSDGRLFIGALVGASALVALLTCATIPLSLAMAGWTHP